MRNLKKILALVLALMMVLSVMVTSSAAFEDAAEIQHSEAVEVMSNLGILLGDGTNFNPNGTLTRAQAAVIIAKMLEGSVDNISVLVDAVDNPFSDVPAWALDYVLYAYSKGVVRGTSADKYTPNKNLTGYEFGKMVLVAAGICKDADFNNNWKMVVADKLNKTGLLAGLSDLVLSKDLSREHAAQLAFNAMNYATTSNYGYPVYEVATGDVLGFYPTIIEAATAAKVLGAEYTYGKNTVKVGNDSLAAAVFGLNTVYALEGIGYEGYYWYADVDGIAGYNYQKDVKVSSFICTDKVVGTFTKANAEKEVVAALGKTTDVTGTAWANGVEGSAKTFGAKSNAKVETDSDVTLTVVVRADKSVDFLYAREYLEFAARGNKITDKKSANYGLYPWTFGSETVYGAADAYVNGAAYLVTPNLGQPVITAAAPVVGKITAKGLGYIKVDDVRYNLSDLSINATLGATVAVYLNSASEVIYIGSVSNNPTAVVYDGYVYVTAVQYTATPYVTTQLVGSGAEATISAKAIVTDIAGNTAVVDVATNVKKISAYSYVPQYWLNGKFVDVDTYNSVVTVPAAGWMAYTLDENGAYKLDTMTTQTVTSAENYKAVLGIENVNYYMDANTEIAFYYYNLDTGAVRTHTTTGYADYKSGQWMNGQECLVVADPTTKVISSITFFKTENVSNSVEYAVYAGVIEETGDGNVYGFIVDGKLTLAYAKIDLTATLSVGDIVNFKTDADGIVTTASKTTLSSAKVVTAVAADGSYFLCGSEIYYFDDYGYVVFDAVNGYAAGELSVGQTVLIHNTNYGVDLIVIAAHPAE